MAASDTTVGSTPSTGRGTSHVDRLTEFSAVPAYNPKQEQTDFFRIKSFGGLAENAGKYLGKGSKVFVQGRIEPTKYEKEGKTEYGFDFIAEEIEYLDTKAPGGGQ